MRVGPCRTCHDVRVAVVQALCRGAITSLLQCYGFGARPWLYVTPEPQRADRWITVTPNAQRADLVAYVTSDPLHADLWTYITHDTQLADAVVYVVNPDALPRR